MESTYSILKSFQNEINPLYPYRLDWDMAGLFPFLRKNSIYLRVQLVEFLAKVVLDGF